MWMWKFFNPKRQFCGFKNIRICVDGTLYKDDCHTVEHSQLIDHSRHQGRIQDFLGGGALVSCSASAPINHIFFLQNTSCIRKPQVVSGRGGAHPLHPPPRSAPGHEHCHIPTLVCEHKQSNVFVRYISAS